MSPTHQGGAPSFTQKINALADQYMAAYIAHHPEETSLYGVPGAAWDRLNDRSPQAIAAWEAEEDRLLSELARVDQASLVDRRDWVTCGILREALEASRAMRIVQTQLWPVNQMSGWHISKSVLARTQPVGTPEAREQALRRWNGLPDYIDTELAALHEGLRRGYSTPQPNVQLVIEQLEGLLALPVERSPFFSPAERDPDPGFRQAWFDLVKDKLYPAVRKYRDYLRVEYLPRARTEIALAAHPDGEAAYQACLRQATTLETTAEEILRRGQEAVQRNRERLCALGAVLLGTSDPDALRRRIASDPENHFKTGPEMLAFCEATLDRARQAIPQWFGLIPQAEVVIQPIPPHEEKATSSNYRPAPEDGSRPGVFNLNMYRPEQQTYGSVEVTVIHEAYPGHHLQVSIARESKSGHPITRMIFNGAYVEGWARYAEALGDEMGLYQSPYARIGRLAWPARGMVVDPGIHVFGWTRQQAYEYIMEAGTQPADMAASLVDRIVALPGQLTSYDTGGLEFFALRRKAEEALGGGFDVRKFHDAVLEDGGMTLSMLRQKVEAWIKQGQS